MATKVFSVKKGDLSSVLSFIESRLKARRVPKQSMVKALLASEESLVKLMEHGEEPARVSVSVRWLLGDVTLQISMPGKAFAFPMTEPELQFDREALGAESEGVIRDIVLKSLSQIITYRNRSGRNTVTIQVERSSRQFLYRTLAALGLAVVCGLSLGALLPASANAWLAATVLGKVQSLFMNGLKMVVAPIVFLSIVESVAQFSNLKDIGRIGGKVIGLYFLTSVIAVCVGMGLSFLLRPGSPEMVAGIQLAAVQTAEAETVSLWDTLIGVVPGNFLKPFLENDMLQIIFLAIICGVALGAIGEKGNRIRELFSSLSAMFMRITMMFVQMVPLMVFCSILSTMLQSGTNMFGSVLSIFLTDLLGFVLMGVVYCLLLLLLGKVNPLVLVKKYAGTMLQVFSLSSSNASISLNMDACEKKLGISPKLYSFSIPLGATLNMDGLCVNLTIVSLALARAFGIQLSFGDLLSVGLTIIVISMGMPGIPGTMLIGLTMILSQLRVPVEAISLVMGIYAIVDMFETASNCLGDVTVTAIVARNEKLLDEKVFYSK